MDRQIWIEQQNFNENMYSLTGKLINIVEEHENTIKFLVDEINDLKKQLSER